jgi:hypothetical protein
MSVLHVRHIKAQLEARYRQRIDLSDLTSRPPAEQEQCFLSRGLAAYAIAQVAEIDDDRAAASVVDGFQDNGVDAVYVDSVNDVLHVVQSKWMDDGNGSIDRSDAQKFIKGVQDLIGGEFDRFNEKLRAKEVELLAALENPRVKVALHVVYTGNQPLGEHAQRDFQDLLDDVNDTSELVGLSVLSQREIYRFISGEAEGDPIRIELALREWGHIAEPYKAYYGQVNAEDVAQWAVQFGPRLFARNLRKFLESTDVNAAIASTLGEAPQHFWYFNNGITALCSKVEKKPLGGPDRATGLFVCHGVNVVNGAQTVGSIREAWAKNPDALKTASVHVRFISLENCPEHFATAVTRATNTQNRIERRDFAALDPEQQRLKTELYLGNGKEYAFKSGDPAPKPDDGCTIDEATVALACALPDISLAVQAKREIGKLWEDITKAPYKQLFSARTSASRLWRSVEVLRIVEDELKALSSGRTGRERLLPVHGNRFVLHRVFRGLATERFDAPDLDMDAVKGEAKRTVAIELARSAAAIERLYPNSYLSTLFKNASKCKAISKEIEREVAGSAIAPPAATQKSLEV